MFQTDNRLEDLDTSANMALDVNVAGNPAGMVYFQCSDVDPNTGFATTSLCAHPVAIDCPVGCQQGFWNYVNVNIEPMTVRVAWLGPVFYSAVFLSSDMCLLLYMCVCVCCVFTVYSMVTLAPSSSKSSKQSNGRRRRL